MRLLIFVLLLIFGLAGSASATPPTDVSIVQLIANPERYDGQQVRVIGFLRLEFEGNAIYLHREDYERSILQNSIWIDLTDSQENSAAKLNNSYVLVEGKFDVRQKGHFGMWPGSLQQVRRLDSWSVSRGKRCTAALKSLCRR